MKLVSTYCAETATPVFPKDLTQIFGMCLVKAVADPEGGARSGS